MLVQCRGNGSIQEIDPSKFNSSLYREVVPRGTGQVAREVFEIESLHRASPILERSYDGDAHTVEITFSTGERVHRSNWFGDEWLEELDVSPEAVNLGRAVGAPFLDAHSRYRTADVVGVIERAWLEPIAPANKGKRAAGSGSGATHEARAVVRFSQDAQSSVVEQKIADGILRQVSVGYSVQRYEKIEPKSDAGRELDFEMPLYIARAWTPLEISSVPIGADAGAKVRGSDEHATTRCLVEVPITLRAETAAPENPRGGNMIRVRIRATGAAEEIRAEDFNPKLHECLDDAGREAVRAAGIELEAAATASVTDSAALDAARAEGVQAERTRANAIRTAVRQAGLSDAVAEELVGRDNLTVGQARAEVLARLAAASDAERVRSAVEFPRGGLDADTTRREAASEALLHRAAPNRQELTERALDFRGMTLLEIARDCLEARGEPHRGISKMELAQRALTVGGSDLPAIVADVANKSLRMGYEGAPRTFTAWCRRGTLPDFKNATRVQYGKVPSLLPVGEHGEFRYATVADSGETYALLTYGRIVGITRQLLVNDDLDALSRQPELFGRAAADLESDLVYAVLTANADMADGVALFHATHGNLTSSGTVISIASLGIARALMRLQKGLEADSVLNVAPRYIIVPAALETLAQQTVSPLNQSQIAASSPAGINVFAGTLEPIAEPRLDASSAVSWYLAADPAAIDTIEYSFLEGEEGLMTETRQGFEIDGMEVKARLDFGTKAIDHRGLYKNAGT